MNLLLNHAPGPASYENILAGNTWFVAHSVGISPRERQGGCHVVKGAIDGIQQALQRAVQAIGGDLALEVVTKCSRPD